MSRSTRGTRRAPRTAWWRSTTAKAVLSLGVVLGVGSVGTLAYFTDDATLNSGGFTTGTLDLTLDQVGTDPNPTIGGGGSIAKATLGIANLIPGESVAADVKVANNGSVPFSYKANGKVDNGSTFPTTAPVRLTFAVFPGTASNSGTQAAGNRAGTCSTGTPLFAAAPLSSAAQDVITTARQLVAGASESICIVVRLDPAAANDYQNKSATATFVFRAAQAGQTP